MAFCALQNTPSILFLHVLLIIHTTYAATNDSDTSQDGYIYNLCPHMEAADATRDYQNNLNTVLSYLSSNSTTKDRFYNATVGTGDGKVYGLFFCRLDITDAICQECVSKAINALTTRCPGKKQSIVWYFDQCVVRYADEQFLGTMLETPMIPMWNRENTLDIWDVTSNMTGEEANCFAGGCLIEMFVFGMKVDVIL